MNQHPAPPATEAEDKTLPIGVVRRALEPIADARGGFTEIFRRSWPIGIDPLQWGLLQSAAGVLRGVHVHLRHDEFILVTAGTMLLGLKDLRPDSPSSERSALVRLAGERPELVTLPRGVAHGFYYATDASLLLATSHYYDPTDDLGCHWADPALGIAWPIRNPAVSERDRTAPPLAELMAALARRG